MLKITADLGERQMIEKLLLDAQAKLKKDALEGPFRPMKPQSQCRVYYLRYIKANTPQKLKVGGRARCHSTFSLRWSEQINLLPRLWTTSQDLTSDPFRAMRREMENAIRAAYDQNLPSSDIGAGAPAINVAETTDAFEVTAELPGVDDKDIKVSLDENQLVISGEKKAESTKEKKDWHVEERSYGSFYRSIALPFEPEDGAVEAHFDKGVLHLTIKKPAKAIKTTKTIDIKTGTPPNTNPAPRKAA